MGRSPVSGARPCQHPTAAAAFAAAQPAVVELKRLVAKYPTGTLGWGEEAKRDRERAKVLSQTIRTFAKGPEVAGIGGNISEQELYMLDAIAPPDPLATRYGAIASDAAKGGAGGAAVGLGVPAPGASVLGGIGGALAAGYGTYAVNPAQVAYDEFSKTIVNKLDAFAGTHFKVLPPKSDGSLIGKPLSLGAVPGK